MNGKRAEKRILSLLLCVAIVILAVMPALAVNYLTGKRDLQSIGHRGYSAEAPENTLASFRLAGESGFDCAECDISPTKDGRWVIMHDATVDRTTDGTGKVSDLTFSEIRKLKIDKGNNIDRYPDERVPELTEYLDICLQYEMTPVIEIKSQTKASDLEALAELLYTRAEWRTFIFISFSQDLIKTIKMYMPANLCFILTNTGIGTELTDFCKKNNIDGIDFRYTAVTDEMIKQLTDEGLIAVAWTVNDTDKIEHLYETGVRYITTDKIIIEQCSCICHSTNPIGRIHALYMRLYWYFTGKNKTCMCGATHYNKH